MDLSGLNITAHETRALSTFVVLSRTLHMDMAARTFLHGLGAWPPGWDWAGVIYRSANLLLCNKLAYLYITCVKLNMLHKLICIILADLIKFVGQMKPLIVNNII